MKLSSHPLLKPFVGKPAILDSNLLLLYWLVPLDSRLIQTFKRLSSFRDEDFILLAELLKSFSSLRTTPHVLTEVSNLANALPASNKSAWTQHFGTQIQVVEEKFVSSASIASGPWMKLGLTDAGLIELATKNVIITVDFPLSNCLESRGLNVINFAVLRNTLLA